MGYLAILHGDRLVGACLGLTHLCLVPAAEFGTSLPRAFSFLNLALERGGIFFGPESPG